MSRLLNIMIVSAWLLSQVLVVSHSQADGATDHQFTLAMVTQSVSDGDNHQHHQSGTKQSHDEKSASSDDGASGKLPCAKDECCDIACQSATVLNSSELAAPYETSAVIKFTAKSPSCWSPGFVCPPPNPAA